jgi:methyl-accepting chemotaxis protein
MARAVNPLALPVAAIEAMIELPRTLAALRRSSEDLARMVESAELLKESADAVLEAFGRAERTAEKLLASGESLVEATGRAEGLVDRLIDSGESLLASAEGAQREARAATEALERSLPTIQELSRLGEPILQASIQAREQLVETQQELSRANAQIARILDMSGPLERASDRLERIVSRVRRDS